MLAAGFRGLKALQSPEVPPNAQLEEAMVALPQGSSSSQGVLSVYLCWYSLKSWIDTLWLFNIAMENMAHRNRWFT